MAAYCTKVSAQAKPGFTQQETMKVAGITVDSMIYSLPVSQKQTARVYYDGLGRPIQSVALQSSPAGNDIIAPVVYDHLGRQTVSYLPYAGQAADTMGSYRANALTAQAAFYNQTTQYLIPTDTAAHARQVFENSPLQRMLETGMAGTGYQPGDGGTQHYKVMAYRPNSNTADGHIYLTGTTGIFTATAWYPDGALWVTDAKDEDNHEALVYKDKAGRLVLKREVTGSTPYDTYYVYNNAGMLKYIVPPKAIHLIAANGYTITSPQIANLIYTYTYNTLGLLIYKTAPNKGTTFIIYDPQNRPLLTRDSNLYAKHQWYYIKYDAKSRPVETGVYTDAAHTTYSAMLSYVNAAYGSTWYEKRSTSATYQYYTNQAFPTTGLTPMTYAYYDNYDFNGDGAYDYHYKSQGLPNEETATTDSLKGQPTMSLRLMTGPAITGTTSFLMTVLFYDHRGNLIQSQTNNQLYYTAATLTDTKTTVPDFTGKPLITKTTVVTGTGTGTTNSVTSTLNYDSKNMRLSSIDQQYNAQATKRIVSYVYSETGQVVLKKLDSLNSHWLQNVDYRYNIRGQLTSINNSKLSADTGKTSSDSNDLFGMQIMYDKPDTHIGTITPSYSGMISAVKWMSRNSSDVKTNERSYIYNYDKVGRDTSSWYAERDTASTSMFNINTHGFDEFGITYDEAGNIQTLKRNSSSINAGSHTLVDNLSYTYDGTLPNQLNNVYDATGNIAYPGFRNLTGSTGNYAYDHNGNLVTDPYKGLTLKYNTMVNRADSLMFNVGGSTAYITYTYDAAGSVVRKQLWSNSTTLASTTDYIGGFVYTTPAGGSATLSYIQNAEGRIINNAGTLTAEYVISDQQGNARFSFSDDGTNLVIRQENSYYAFGEIMANSPVPLPTTPNINLYNGGSEWQNLLNNMPDYNQTFYRNYDPAIGRFIAVDPMPENAESLNVYQYAGNNPVMMNDPMGNLLDPSRLSHPANNPPIIPAPNPNAWGNDGPGNDDDPNWMNDGAFDTAGPFSSDGGLAGGAFWNDYTSSWNSILSGTGFEANNTGAVMNNNAGRDAYLYSLYSNANGTRIFDFDANGNLTGNTLDEDAGPGGIIATMAGQGTLNLPKTLQLLGLTQSIDLNASQEGNPILNALLGITQTVKTGIEYDPLNTVFGTFNLSTYNSVSHSGGEHLINLNVTKSYTQNGVKNTYDSNINLFVYKWKFTSDIGVEQEFGTDSWNINFGLTWKKGLSLGAAVNGHGFDFSYRPNAAGLLLIGVAVVAPELLPEAYKAVTSAQ